jgi:hypothetical protein
MMVIYTASFGRRITPSNKQWPKTRMVCFSDIKPPEPWEWVKIDPSHEDPVRSAKLPKILPWLFIDEWDESLWIDCNMVIKKLPSPKDDIAFHQHRSRKCIFKEAHVCISKGKDDKEIIENQMERYKNFPINNGLWEGGLIYRRNTDKIKALCEDWMNEIDNGSRRDQLSLPVVLDRHGIVPTNLGPGGKHSLWVKEDKK